MCSGWVDECVCYFLLVGGVVVGLGCVGCVGVVLLDVIEVVVGCCSELVVVGG